MKSIKSVLLIIIVLLFTNSCKKFVEGYEKDPNGFLESNDEQIMQGVLLQNQFFNHSDGLRLAMIFMNQATGTDRQYVAFNNWNSVGHNQFDMPWAEVYSVISEAKLLEQEADKISNLELRGLAKLYRAWAGGMAASLWGDVPFSQAADMENYPTPKYDNMSDVFNQVQTLLDEAISDLSSGQGVIYSDKDIYFNGDASKWIKIAHGLKARFYLTVGDYTNALLHASQGPSSPADDMIAPYDVYPGVYDKYNPMFQFTVWNRDGYLGCPDTYAVDLMLNLRTENDESSRLNFNYIYYPGFGITEINAWPGYWFLGHDGKFGGPQPLLTYGEMLLIQAESEARLNGVASALGPYNQYRALLNAGGYYPAMGTFNFGNSYPPFALADFQNGGSQNPDNVTELQAFLRELFEERYLYFIGDYQAFVDHARTFNDPDVPQYMQLKAGFSGAPLRFIYPQTEIDANPNTPNPAPSITDPLPMF